MQSVRSLIKNQRGIGIVEGLVGSVIVGITAVGLGVSINMMAKARIKTQSVSGAVALESVIINALQDPETYRPFQAILKAGDINRVRSELFLPAPSWGNGQLRPSLSGQFFSMDGSTCSGGFSNKACVLSLKFDVRMDTPAPNPSYSFAYSIETNNEVVVMAPIGVPPSPNFRSEDYKLAMPSSVVNDELIACEETNAIAANGFDFDTGRLHCLEAPRLGASPSGDDCPVGSFPVALTLSGNRVVFQCQALRSVSCNDAFYALNNFMPSSLDPRNPSLPTQTANSRCDFTGQTTVTARTGPSYSRLPLTGTSGMVRSAYGVTNGIFCPTGYRARIVSCTANVAVTANTPANQCPTGYPLACPPAPAGTWYGATGGYADPLVSPINVGQTLSSVSGQRATCVLRNGGQPGMANNQAGWSGFINMSVACDVDTGTWPPRRPSQCTGAGC